jgi:hypothetical protein
MYVRWSEHTKKKVEKEQVNKVKENDNNVKF